MSQKRKDKGMTEAEIKEILQFSKVMTTSEFVNSFIAKRKVDVLKSILHCFPKGDKMAITNALRQFNK